MRFIKKAKIKKIILLSFLALGMIFVFNLVKRPGKNFTLSPRPVQAQTAGDNTTLKDSDYDGLTDQAEINRYHTDPNSADTDKDGYLDAAEVLSGSNPNNPGDPANFLNTQEQVPAPTSVPWFVSRSAAITAYLLMFFIIVLGTGMTTGVIYEIISPPLSWSIHKYLSISLGLTLLLHILFLLFDKFINFGLLDLLIPFHASFRPLYVSFGVFGFYILLIIILSSLLVRSKFSFFWRSAHYFTYPLFIFSFFHGIFTGTDTKFLPMQFMYWSTGIVFLALLALRFIFYRRDKSS